MQLGNGSYDGQHTFYLGSSEQRCLPGEQAYNVRTYARWLCELQKIAQMITQRIKRSKGSERTATR